MDGADGVIIYDDIPFRDDDNSGSMVCIYKYVYAGQYF